MRRFICIAMIALFSMTIFTGFAEGHVHPGKSGIHTVLAILFVASTLAHVIINRKAFMRYFAGVPKTAN